MSLSTLTISAVNYQSYASNTEADEYLGADIKRATAWAALTEDEQNQSLVSATRYLDSFKWDGDMTDEVTPQTEEWPRTGLTDKNGIAVPTATIPQEVEDATILLAYEVSQNTSLFDTNDTGNNVKRVKAGSVEIENFRSESGTPLAVSAAFDLVGLWLAGNLSNAIFAFASGTSVDTATGRLYERTEGFP